MNWWIWVLFGLSVIGSGWMAWELWRLKRLVYRIASVLEVMTPELERRIKAQTTQVIVGDKWQDDTEYVEIPE